MRESQAQEDAHGIGSIERKLHTGGGSSLLGRDLRLGGSLSGSDSFGNGGWGLLFGDLDGLDCLGHCELVGVGRKWGYL